MDPSEAKDTISTMIKTDANQQGQFHKLMDKARKYIQKLLTGGIDQTTRGTTV